jgi:hypothetical protein
LFLFPLLPPYPYLEKIIKIVKFLLVNRSSLSYINSTHYYLGKFLLLRALYITIDLLFWGELSSVFRHTIFQPGCLQLTSSQVSVDSSSHPWTCYIAHLNQKQCSTLLVAIQACLFLMNYLLIWLGGFIGCSLLVFCTNQEFVFWVNQEFF